MNTLTGKIALITGAERGMGRAFAERLAHDGADIVVHYVFEEDDANQTVAAIRQLGRRAVAIRADIAKRDDVENLFEQTIDRLGQPNILINNAGVAVLTPLAELKQADIDRVFDINAKGTLYCLSEAAKHLSDGGRVVNIASSTVAFAFEGASLYAGSKAAVRAYTEVAAIELGKRGITVNTILPGITNTPMTEHFSDEFRRRVADTSPFKRVGQPEDIAAVVAYLVSDDAHWLTGQHIVANGGGKV